jgi:ABC-type glycerol-3-phosphate transport system permease component
MTATGTITLESVTKHFPGGVVAVDNLSLEVQPGEFLVLSVWGEFLIPLLLTSTSNAKPVTVLITEYVGKYTTNYPILAAAGVLALIPPALLALVLNKRITGMLAGSS